MNNRDHNTDAGMVNDGHARESIYQPAFKDDDHDAPLNADLNAPVIIDTDRVAWSDSPSAGVERKRLEVIPGERPQLTTLVRFTPGSQFPRHTHDGGEEFLVLSGVFSDEFGDYCVGSYVRNPPGMQHAPYTLGGCLLFIKLRQFQANDRRQVVHQVGDVAESHMDSTSGFLCQELHSFNDERVSYLKKDGDVQVARLQLNGGCELFLVSGELQINGQLQHQGCWCRFPLGMQLGLVARKPVTFYLKEGPQTRY